MKKHRHFEKKSKNIIGNKNILCAKQNSEKQEHTQKYNDDTKLSSIWADIVT